MKTQDITLLAAALFMAPHGQAATPPDVIHWRGEGMQIYSCQTLQGGYAWTLERPDATLTDLLGHVRGHHDGGPSWTAADGSRIVGQLVTAIPAPRPNAIPWLVLRAATHEGHGVLDSVTYVLRTETVGGVAPASGCDPLHAGAETQVPYQANYSFLTPVAEPAPQPLQQSSR